MNEQNPLQIGKSRIGSLDYHVIVGPQIWDFTQAYKSGIPVDGKITNFTQTVGTEHQTNGGFGYGYPYYGGFTWRDIPKAINYLQYFEDQIYPEGIHASFVLSSSETEGYYDLVTTVIEASNGHKYWLGQTVTVLLFNGANPVSISYEFTEEDWDTTPVVDPPNGVYYGYEANPDGPSKFTRRHYEFLQTDDVYTFSMPDSTTMGDPQSPFQPPGG